MIERENYKFTKIREKDADETIRQSPNVYGIIYKGKKIGEVEHNIYQYSSGELRWYAKLNVENIDREVRKHIPLETSSSRDKRGSAAEDIISLYKRALEKKRGG